MNYEHANRANRHRFDGLCVFEEDGGVVVAKETPPLTQLYSMVSPLIVTVIMFFAAGAATWLAFANLFHSGRTAPPWAILALTLWFGACTLVCGLASFRFAATMLPTRIQIFEVSHGWQLQYLACGFRWRARNFDHLSAVVVEERWFQGDDAFRITLLIENGRRIPLTPTTAAGAPQSPAVKEGCELGSFLAERLGLELIVEERG